VENNERIVQLLSNAKELTMFLIVNKETSKQGKCPSSKSRIDSDSEVTIQQRQEEAELLCGSNDTRSTSSFLEINKTIDNGDNNHSVPEVENTPDEILIAGRDSPVLKLSYEDQHRRIPFEGHSFQRLTSVCTLFFGVKNTRRMLFQYKDEDGDLVQISTDAELAYALQYCATNTNPRVLRLQFSLKQWKNKKGSPEDNQSSRDLCTPNNADSNHEKVSTTRALPMKKLQEGDVIQLSNSGGLHLVLSSNHSQEEEEEFDDDDQEEKRFKRKFKKMKPQFIVSAGSDDSEASQWIVEKALPKKKKKNDSKNEGVNIDSKKDDQEIFFLKNKKKSTVDNSYLRVNQTGEKVVHKSGTGIWARFCVEYVGSSGCIRLRSVGRSHLKNADAAANAFLGIVQEASKSDASQVVRANLNKNDKRALFFVRFF